MLFGKKTLVLYYHNCYFQEKVALGYLATWQCRCPEGSMCIPAATVCIMCFNPFHFGVFCTFKSGLSSCAFVGIKLEAVRLERLLKLPCYVKPFGGWYKNPAEAVVTAYLKPPEPFPRTLSGNGESKALRHAEPAPNCRLHWYVQCLFLIMVCPRSIRFKHRVQPCH